jgi:hypothetical protein
MPIKYSLVLLLMKKKKSGGEVDIMPIVYSLSSSLLTK